MTPEDVTRRLSEIDTWDDESAHAAQDRLYVDVLEAIAASNSEPVASALAEAALKVRQLDFSRWYA